ncbi:MAG TPA: hypothetical protein VFU81_01075, partial [Thermomicrobiales bacterium]|nr:hypothetical protein [Thermomicrobiales bacterium]
MARYGLTNVLTLVRDGADGAAPFGVSVRSTVAQAAKGAPAMSQNLDSARIAAEVMASDAA